MADSPEPKKETVGIGLPVGSGAQGPTPPLPAASPKKETARITILPDPPSRLPTATAPETSLLPKALCWALVGISVLTLLIQIWNFLS
jgi:hypothetical protein